MAIETTYFTATDHDANWEEVRAWLAANATEYFDTIDGTTWSNEVICKNDGKEVLKLNFTSSGGTSLFAVYLKNGVSIGSSYWDKSRKFVKAYKTDNGICLWASNTDNIMIAKTAEGANIVAVVTNAISGALRWYIGDATSSAAFVASSTQGSSPWANSNIITMGVNSAGKTSLVPAVTDSGTYSENLFFVPFTQFFSQGNMIIDIDGTKYVYNGVFALKE